MKSKKRKLICQKPTLGKRIKVIFKGLDWGLFIGFCILACHFMNNVIYEYQAKKSSFIQSLEPIDKLPTVVICFESKYTWFYGKHVNVSYETPNTFVHLKDYLKYDLSDDNEVVEINQYNSKCIKINTTLVEPFQQSHYRKIYIKVQEYDAKYMPDYIHVYFTSEENSYGRALDWWDGNVFEQRLDWKKAVEVKLKPFKYRYLDDDSKCSQQSNIARIKSFMKDANFTNCLQKCSPFYFLNDLMPLCGWEDDKLDDYYCAYNAIIDYWYEIKISHGYKKPCTVLEYQGEKTYEWNIEGSNRAVLEYQFAPPMMTNVQQEYLIFDLVGMIGSVGGTLGMCIGFSFSGVTTFILDFIQARIVNYFSS